MILIAFKSPQTDNPVACHSGLGITAANNAEVLREHGYQAEAVAVRDGFDLRNRLRLKEWPGVTDVLMNAPFFDTAFLKQLLDEFPRLAFAVIYHSNVGFLGSDTWSTGVLLEQLALQTSRANFRVAVNSAHLSNAVSAATSQPCALLPNLYFLPGPVERQRQLWTSGTLRIGTFGATRVLKNLPTAAWAAAIISRKLGASTEFWISAGRQEGAGASAVTGSVRKLFAGLGSHVSLIEAPWQPWLTFRASTVRRMHVLLQPSFTESFNNVTADGVAEGVASVVGPAIAWAPKSWQANPDDASDVANAGCRLLRDKNAVRDGYRALSQHNDAGVKLWAAFL